MNTKPNSLSVTKGIKVEVFPEYIPEQSSPDDRKYFYSYRVVITNNSSGFAKLLSRHWLIINAEGEKEEFEGTGVVGYTPELEPGESFEYSSYCTINTSWGTMEGKYMMMDEKGNTFDVEVARFYLFDPEYVY
jgi:ApaG protein